MGLLSAECAPVLMPTFFIFLICQPTTHTHSHTHTHRHTQSSAIKTNKYKAIAALGEFVSSYECVCKEEAHTHTHARADSHLHARIHANRAAVTVRAKSKRRREHENALLLDAASCCRVVRCSLCMLLLFACGSACVDRQRASDKRPLVAADTGDEQQQVGGAGGWCYRIVQYTPRISNQ